MRISALLCIHITHIILKHQQSFADHRNLRFKMQCNQKRRRKKLLNCSNNYPQTILCVCSILILIHFRCGEVTCHTIHCVLNPLKLTFAAQVSIMWFTTKHNSRNAKYVLVVGIPLRLKQKKHLSRFIKYLSITSKSQRNNLL